MAIHSEAILRINTHFDEPSKSSSDNSPSRLLNCTVPMCSKAIKNRLRKPGSRPGDIKRKEPTRTGRPLEYLPGRRHKEKYVREKSVPTKENTPEAKEESPVPEQRCIDVQTVDTPHPNTSIQKRCPCESHASILQKLHLRICAQPLPTEKTPDRESMLEMISAWVPQTQAIRILHALEVHFRYQHSHVTAFRASIVYSFSNESCSWPVIEWREGEDTEVMAIFLLNDEGTVCSWLMHHGYGRTEAIQDGGNWKSTYISWCVEEIRHLKSLFEAAQHLWGILQWKPEEILNFYCKRDLGSGSEEQMVRHATLLYIHVRELERLNGKFEDVSPVMEKLSKMKRKSLRNDGLTVQRFLGSMERSSGCGALLGRQMTVPETWKCEYGFPPGYMIGGAVLDGTLGVCLVELASIQFSSIFWNKEAFAKVLKAYSFVELLDVVLGTFNNWK